MTVTTLSDDELAQRHLLLPGTHNVRDIGGYPAAGNRTTRWRTLFRADALHRLDDAGQATLRALGVRTVVDLREHDEATAAPDQVSGLDAVMIALPLFDRPTDAVSGPRTLSEVYALLVDSRPEALVRAVRAIAVHGRPSLVHCTAGKDRTGMVIALTLSALGVPDEVIAADFAATGRLLGPAFREALLAHGMTRGVPGEEYSPMLSAEPELILGFLDRVRTGHGDVATFLLHHGMTDDELATLRDALLTPNEIPSPEPTDLTPEPGPDPYERMEPAPMSGKRLVIQISDTHILGDGLLHDRVDTFAALESVLTRIEESAGTVDAIVFTGDLADSGDPAAYQRLRDLVEPAAKRLGTRICLTPGNHDEREAFRSTLLDGVGSGPIDRVLWAGGLRIISLDTSVPGQHHGELSTGQLAALAAELATPAPEGTVLAIHHPPIPSPSGVANLLRLRRPEALGEVIAGRDVLLVVSGHAHHTSCGVLAGVPVWIAPAVAYQADVIAPPDVLRGIPGVGFTRIDIEDGVATATAITIEPGVTPVPVYDMRLSDLMPHLRPTADLVDAR